MTYNKIDFNNKTILITGGAGFIGSNLAFYFEDNYPQANVVVFDCFRNERVLSNGNPLSFGHYKNLIGFTGDVICGNINNKSNLALLNDYKFDYIFHQAAISDTRVYDQEIVMRTNVNSFYDLLQIAKKDQATIVYASSGATYGSLPSPQTVGKENPENPYGFSKFLMDQIAYRYIDENPELMNAFLTNGSRAIPVVIMLDEDFNVLQTWGPRSKAATKLVSDYKEHHGKIDDAFKEMLQVWYNNDKGVSIVNDISTLVAPFKEAL